MLEIHEGVRGRPQGANQHVEPDLRHRPRRAVANVALLLLSACAPGSVPREASVIAVPSGTTAPASTATGTLPQCDDAEACLERADGAKKGGQGSQDAGAGMVRATLYARACELGHPRGCLEVARAYASGEATEPRADCAARFHERACELGNMESCAVAGSAYDENGVLPTDLARAASLNRKACDGGVMDGCVSLAWAYHWGKGVTLDEGQAARLFGKVCEEGKPPEGSGGLETLHERYCSYFAEALSKGQGVPKDEAQAARIFEHACENMAYEVCPQFAEMLAKGAGVPKNVPRAAALLEETCTGFHAGCDEALEMFRSGPAKDPVKAAAIEAIVFGMTAQSCREQGMLEACEALVQAFSGPKAPSADASVVLSFLSEACDLGNVRGCRLAARRVAQGIGVAKNAARAAALEERARAFADTTHIKDTLERACEAHGGVDCYLLGDAYQNGRKEWNIAKDAKRGLELFGKACSGGASEYDIECRVAGSVENLARDLEPKVERRCELLPLPGKEPGTKGGR